MNNNNLHKLRQCVIVILMFVAIFAVMAFDSRPPVIIHKYEIKQPAYRGEPIILKIEATNLRDCDGIVSRTFYYNGLSLSTPKIPSIVRDVIGGSGRMKYTRKIELPDFIVGEVTMKTTVERYCNFIQEYFPIFRIKSEQPTKIFTILESPYTPQGLRGLPGPAGEKGDTGSKGDQGETGPAGKSFDKP